MSEFMFSPGPGHAELLYDYTCAAAKASIDTNVDGPMAHLFPTDGALLEFYVVSRTDEAVNGSGLDIILNNDSGSNYDESYIDTSITSVSGGGATGLAGVQLVTAGANLAAGTAGIVGFTIPAYGDTTFNKVIYGLLGYSPQVSNRQIDYEVWTWRNTAAVTRIKVFPHTGGKNLVAGSRLLVYRR